MRATGFGDDVQELAAEHLGADVGPHPLNAALSVGRQAGFGHDVVGPDQRQVAEQNGRRTAELLRRAPPAAVAVQLGEVHVCGRHAPAGGGVVDDVVVHEGAGVQQFQRREQSQHAVVDRLLGIRRHRPVAPVRESRAQPLAAAQDEVLQNGDQPVVVRTDVGGPGPAGGQMLPKLFGDRAGQLGGRRCCCVQTQRGAPFCAVIRPRRAPRTRGRDGLRLEVVARFGVGEAS